MPIAVRIDKEADLVSRTVTGSVSGEELIASFQDTLDHPDYHPGMKSLMDFRLFDHQLGSQDMRKFADFFLERSDAVRGTPTAVVVSQAVSYGLVRMLQAYIEAAPITLEVFYDLEEAERWLGIR